MQFSPAGTAPTGAEARPEWSVASEARRDHREHLASEPGSEATREQAEGGMRRAVRAVRTLSFHKERIPPFTAGVNPTLVDQSTDDTLAGYSTVIHNY